MLEEHQSACPIPLLEKLDETGIEEISSFGFFFSLFLGNGRKRRHWWPTIAAISPGQIPLLQASEQDWQ